MEAEKGNTAGSIEKGERRDRWGDQGLQSSTPDEGESKDSHRRPPRKKSIFPKPAQADLR